MGFGSVFRTAACQCGIDSLVRLVDRSATVSYDPLIGFDVEAQMFNLQSTIYLRYEFDLANPSELQSLNLRMIWDDGFVAYLNGQEIKRQQFGAASTPVWNSPSEATPC